MSEHPSPSAKISVLGIIPARGGSKGLPGKNIASLGGIPLIAHTILAARQSKALTDVIVSTDSESIAEVARAYGLAVPWLRPPDLSGDAARVQDAVRHALQRHPQGERFDYLLLLQPTAPFRSAEDIDHAIRMAAQHAPDTVVSFVREETCHPYYMYYYAPGPGSPQVRPFVRYEPGLPRQEFPPCVYRNGAIYLVRRGFFLEKNAFVSESCMPYLMPRERSLNIDTPDDLAYAEYLMARGKKDGP